MHYTLNIKGKSYSITQPKVMGILNCTPDSFYAGSRKQTEQEIADRANEIITQGAAIIDVGGMSTRPGGTFVTEEEEMERLRFALPIVRREQPDAIISVDTYRPMVAKMSVEEFGADIINDVGAPENHDLHNLEAVSRDEMYSTVARLKVPYILMASQPTVDDTLSWFTTELHKLRRLGVKDIILDPGYGFGKTIEQNYELLDALDEIVDFYELPVLVGISRKRMIWQKLGISADEALNGTTVLNTLALERGAAILRVHDVREAVECVKIVSALS